MTQPCRILVTGSRHWTDGKTIAVALLKHGGRRVTLVHGDCPTGADAIAARVGRSFAWTVEPHPADWERHGKAAGPTRNQEMVDLGADVCLAFPLGESRGTRDCVRRAELAGIPVHVFEAAS